MHNNRLFLMLTIPKNTINCKCVINIICTYLSKNIFLFLKEDQTLLRLLFICSIYILSIKNVMS